MSLPAVLIRKSTGEIIKHAPYPREDMGVIVGLDPDLEWLLKHTPFIAPDYDSRYYVLNVTEEVTTDPHPDHAHLNQYKITYDTTKRPEPDIIISVENAETEANEGVIPYTRQLKLIVLGIGVLFKNIDGLQLNQKETKIKNRVMAMAVKVWKNDTEARQKKQAIAAGQEPNIDDGWDNEEPPE